MLGRLARYLRFFGFDTEYVRDIEDAEISRRAVSEGRILLTRDRDLARRTPGALLLRSPDLGAQLREVRRSVPGVEFALAFDRCPECNQPLRHWDPPKTGPFPPELPLERVVAGLAVFECRACGRRYWDGSHAQHIRDQVRGWLTSSGGA